MSSMRFVVVSLIGGGIRIQGLGWGGTSNVDGIGMVAGTLRGPGDGPGVHSKSLSGIHACPSPIEPAS